MKYNNYFLPSVIMTILSIGTFSVRADEQTVPKELPMPLNLAHRGLSYIAPENTLLAFKLAIQIGADAAECDVHRTSDGVLVLSHDKNMKRTMGRDADITKTTFDEFRKADAGKWKGAHFAGETPPTLAEYLLLLKDSTCTPVIEIKQEGTEKDIVDLLTELDMIDKVFIVSFSTKSLSEVKRLQSRLNVGHIFSWKIEGSAEENAETLVPKLMEQAEKVGTNVVSLSKHMVSKKLVDLFHEKGFRVWVWTVNDVSGMEQFLDWKLDSVTSDRPDVLAEIIKERAKK